MASEIEIKAHVKSEERSRVREHLSRLGGGGGSFLKEDVYWKFPNGSVIDAAQDGARVARTRREERTLPNGKTACNFFVTFKLKKRKEGCALEVNEEHEFSVSDGAEADLLFLHLGLQKYYSKKKEGESWNIDGIRAELAEVFDPRLSLGWFLELEILAQNPDTSFVDNAQKRLYSLLASCGIDEAQVETQYYAELFEKARQEYKL